MGKTFLQRVGNHTLYTLEEMGVFDHLSDEQYLKLMFRLRMGKKLDLENPQTYNEKLQWLKLHDRNPLYPTMVDKYEAKKYAADKIGEQYIIPTLGVWNHFDEIDFDKLPDQCVLKTTHDSGGIVICKDKKTLNIAAARKKLEHSLKTNYYMRGREWPYKNVNPRIIAEQYMEDKSGYEIEDYCSHYHDKDREELADYKVWTFNGEPQYIQYITGRNSGDCREGFYTIDWKLQKFSLHNELTDRVKEKPERLDELLELSRKLAKGTSFARTDFYVLGDGSIRFGEISFFPMSGMERWHPEKMDLEMGKKIKLHF